MNEEALSEEKAVRASNQTLWIFSACINLMTIK
jgi:hypothetical protein